METSKKFGSRRWPFQRPSSFLTRMTVKKAGLAGISFLAGILLLGSWNMPFHSQAEISHLAMTASSEAPPNIEKGGFADIAQAVTPAVVNITVRKEAPGPISGFPSDPLREFFGQPGTPEMPGMPNRPGTTQPPSGSR